MGLFDRVSRVVRQNLNAKVAEEGDQASSFQERSESTPQYSQLMSEAISTSKKQDTLVLKKVDDCLTAINSFFENSPNMLFGKFIDKVKRARDQKTQELRLYKLTPPRKNATRNEIEDYLISVTTNAFIEIKAIISENPHLEQEIYPKISDLTTSLDHSMNKHHQSAQEALQKGDEYKGSEELSKKKQYGEVIEMFHSLLPNPYGTSFTNLEMLFQSLNIGGDVDAELEALKKELPGPSMEENHSENQDSEDS